MNESNEPIDDKYVLAFLKNHRLGVLSTVNKDGLPDAAPIYFVVKDNFDIFFVTPVKTQKHTNLDINNNAVLTVTNENTQETVRIRGVTSEQKDQLSMVLKALAEKLDSEFNLVTTLPILKYKNNTKVAVQLKPYEIIMRRYTDEALEEKKVILGK